MPTKANSHAGTDGLCEPPSTTKTVDYKNAGRNLNRGDQTAIVKSPPISAEYTPSLYFKLMTSKATPNDFLADIASSLQIDTTWQLATASSSTSKDVAGQTHEALQSPLEFPSIESAIVPGDRVALAVDPNVPQLSEVITGILKTLALTQAGDIDIVFWDEASEAVIDSVRDIIGDRTTLEVHDSGKRESLRYLAADVDAMPIYLNRRLVDADFVLPVVASRTIDSASKNDVTGVFPSLADSLTRQKHRRRMSDVEVANADDETAQIPWLLGVHMIVAVSVNEQGVVGEVLAGTTDAIRSHLHAASISAVATSQAVTDDGLPRSAELVLASITGDESQQTWANAARALAAASRNVTSEGTIVLWTSIDQTPTGPLARLDDVDDPTQLLDELESLATNIPTVDNLTAENEEQNDPQEVDFRRWDSDFSVALTFARVLSEHRVLIRSLLPHETIEPMGLGVVADQEQLMQMSQSFETCCIVPAAQFADCAVDSPHRTKLQLP
jgi:hypothetical protein